MNTKFSNNHLITSINFTVPSVQNNSKGIIIRKSKNKIIENKENINSNNTSIKILNPKKYDKLRLTLEKKPIKHKLLRQNFCKEQKKINLDSYSRAPLKIFALNSFNNTSIHYSKHKNKVGLSNYNSENNNCNKKDEKKIYYYVDKEKDKYLLLNNSINFSKNINNKNNNEIRIRKRHNENKKNFKSIENERYSNKNKLTINPHFSYINYKTEAKTSENNNYINKSNNHFTNYFSPPRLEIPKKLVGTNDLQKSCQIYSDRRNNQFKSTIINPDDFKIIRQIGYGSFGKIYKALNIKNGGKYVLKMMHNNKNNILYMQEKVRLIMDFQKRIKCDGLIKIYGDACIKKGNQYFYYEILELADRDWEQEIILRRRHFRYYSENELINILLQLVKTLSLMQKNHITHRDIKLQNILLLNNTYKICDFGEARKLLQKGIIVQPVRGSELYMSPIQFFGLEKKLDYVQHNSYKSDVFSLGMCILFAANLSDECLYDIREISDMNEIKNIVMRYLNRRYSIKFIHLLLILLEFKEKNRPDFISLEKIILNSFKNDEK